MGVTDASMLTEAAQRNWVNAVEKEIEARYSWHEKWGWMPPVIGETTRRLRELKQRQAARVLEESTGVAYEQPPERNPAPFPRSTNHEYGWLVTKPEYQIEAYGPWPNNRKQRIEPTEAEVAARAQERKAEEEDKMSAGRASQASLGDLDEEKGTNGAEKTEVLLEGRNHLDQVKRDAQKGEKKSKKIPCCTDSY